MRMLRNLIVVLVLSTGTSAFAQEQQLAPGMTICSLNEAGRTIGLQCSESKRRCLYAFAQIRNDDGLTEVPAEHLPPCSAVDNHAYNTLKRGGYTMVPARLPAPHGYERDERGQVYQTHFDLRRRWWTGVAGTLDPHVFDDGQGFAAGVRVETGAIYERFDVWDSRRNKHRLLEASLLIDPFEVEGLLYQFDRGRNEEIPAIWLTTFVGPPTRFDIDVHLGPGFFIGRLQYFAVEDGKHLFADIAQGHVNWEMFQSRTMETYFLLRFGAGVGVRWDRRASRGHFYYYPEVATQWSWIIDRRGLTELTVYGNVRIADEPTSDGLWKQANGGVRFERVVLAVNDQPITLFAEPQIRWTDLTPTGQLQADFRIHTGLRVNLFAPPREAGRP